MLTQYRLQKTAYERRDRSGSSKTQGKPGPAHGPRYAAMPVYDRVEHMRPAPKSHPSDCQEDLGGGSRFPTSAFLI